MIEISQEDINRGTIVEPAWYRVRVTDYRTEIAKSGKSTNHKMAGVIIKNADTGDTKYAGVPTPMNWMFNSEALGFAVGYLSAVQGGVDIKPGRFDLAGTVGKELDIYFDNGTYNNQLQNQINHKYRPVREG